MSAPQQNVRYAGATAGGYTMAPGVRTLGAPVTLGATGAVTQAAPTMLPPVTYAAGQTTSFGTSRVVTQGAPVVTQGARYATQAPAVVQSAPVTAQAPTIIQGAPIYAQGAPVYTQGATVRPATGRILDPVRIVQAQAIYKPATVVSSDGPSVFSAVPEAPPDAILSLAARFKDDKNPKKVNLGVGAYRTETGKPWPLPSVLEAQMRVAQDPTEDKEYVPIDGKPEHKKLVQQLIFSDQEIERGAIATTQAISGTGSLCVVGQFLSSVMGVKTIHMPKPTWGNHKAIFARAGLESKEYTYYHPATRGFDYQGMLEAIDQIPAGDAILLHSVAQNPTGVDPSAEQWVQIINLVANKGLVPVLDNAYQGYASGSLEQDGIAQRMFEDAGLEYFVCQSFAKNFGLYGERIGYIHVRTATPEMAKAVLSQMKILIRQAYSSPPRHGAAIVYQVLSDPALKQQWLNELAFMANRINEMRWALRNALEQRGTPGTWNHITDQIGMFSYTGLTEPQVKRMVEEFSIYMTKDGRISVAGLNPGNVQYVADCIDTVVR